MRKILYPTFLLLTGSLLGCGNPEDEMSDDVAFDDSAEIQNTDAIFSCPLMSSSGNAGANDLALNVFSINTEAASSVLTVRARNTTTGVTTTSLISLASPTTGVTVTGSFNPAMADARITQITSLGSTMTIQGYLVSTGATITGTLTLSGAQFDGGGMFALARVNRIQAFSSGYLSVTGNPQTVPTSFTSSAYEMFRTCGAVASVTGNTGTITLDAAPVGQTSVSFYVDGVYRGNDTVAPFSIPFNSALLVNGTHNVVARMRDENTTLAISPQTAFTVTNPGPTVSATVTGTSGTITFAATAASPQGIGSVRFYVDGVLKVTDTTSPYSTTFDSRTLANGAHNLVARAYNVPGNFTDSAAVPFTTTNDFTPPTVSVPTVTGTGGTITFAATASDASGIASIQFLVDGFVRGTDTTAPYSLAYNSLLLTNGSHTLVARATDVAGNLGSSTGVAFTVFNDTTGPALSVTNTNIGIGIVRFNVTATDPSGVNRVEFRSAGTTGPLLGTDTTAPYSFDYDYFLKLNNGYSNVALVAYDNLGLSSSLLFAFLASVPTYVETGVANNTIATAQIVPATALRITGFINPALEVDFFRVTVDAGRTLILTSGQNATVFTNYDLAILSAAGVVLANSTTSGPFESATVTNTTAAPVDYYVRTTGISANTMNYFIRVVR